MIFMVTKQSCTLNTLKIYTYNTLACPIDRLQVAIALRGFLVTLGFCIAGASGLLRIHLKLLIVTKVRQWAMNSIQRN